MKDDKKQTTGSKVIWKWRGQTHRYDKYYNPKSRYKSQIILFMHVVYLALDDLESSNSQKFTKSITLHYSISWQHPTLI
jgi:hypothetical protein